MCPSSQIVSQSKNGFITFCDRSKLFQLVFKNLCFELYEWELTALKVYIADIDISYWENQVKGSTSPRRIPISVGLKHFIIILNRAELYEIKQLLNLEKNKVQFLKFDEIEYRHLQN